MTDAKQITTGAPITGGPITGAQPPAAHTRSELSASLAIAVPLVLTNLGNIAINTTDVIMIGWLGAEALAAGILGFTTYFLFMLMGIGIAAAVPPLAAQAHGAGDTRAVRRTVRQGLWAVLIYAIPAMVLLLNGEAILLALGQQAEPAALAGEYLDYAVWSLPFVLAMMVLRGLLATLDRASVVLWITCIGIVANALINYGLIFGNWGMPRLELAGAGIATTITSVSGFAIMAAYVAFHPGTRGYQVFVRLWRPDFERLKAIGQLGIPIALTLLFEEGLFVAATIMVGWFGPLQLAGHAIAMQCAAVAFMVPLGVAQAGTVRVGLAAGRGNLGGIGRAGWTAMALGIGFMAFSALAFWIVPEPLAALYLDQNDPDAELVLSIAVSLLAIAAFFQLFDGAQVVGLGILRGLNDTRVPLGFAVFGYWVCGVPLAYTLGFVAGYGVAGIWIGFILGLGLVAVLASLRFSYRERFGLVAKFVRLKT